MTQFTAEEMARAQRMARELHELNKLSPRTFVLEGSVLDLFRIVGSLQLAWRHPGFDEEQLETIERFARQLQAQIVTPETPELADVLEQGWSREYDR